MTDEASFEEIEAEIEGMLVKKLHTVEQWALAVYDTEYEGDLTKEEFVDEVRSEALNNVGQMFREYTSTPLDPCGVEHKRN